MASITSVGLGSGLDVNSIVDKLVAIEHIPVDNLQTAATKIQTKISSYGKVQSAVSAVRDAAAKLTDLSTWNATSSTSSDTTAVTVTSDTTASAGSYSVEVSSLASSQSLVSSTYAGATSVIGQGTLHITLGDWNASPPVPGKQTDIILTESDNTLEKIRDKINSAGSGVAASVVTDATGSRLVLRSTTTGSASGFQVTASDADGDDADAQGLSALNYDPTATANNMTQTQGASDAKVKINGLEVTSATNTFSGVVQGMTFKVGKVTTNAADVTVTQDVESMKKVVTDFATAYTALNTLIKDQTKYDAANKVSSPLQGDSTINSLLTGMRSILSQTSGASSLYPQLSNIGLSITSTGGVTVDSTKLTAALSGNLADVKKLFANQDSVTPANDGFGQRFKAYADKLLSIDGSLGTRTTGLQKSISNNSKQQAALEDRIALYKKRLLAQYNALDTTMSKLNGTSNYVTQQLAAMTKSS